MPPDAVFHRPSVERLRGRPSFAFRRAPNEVERLVRTRGYFATPYGRGLWVSRWADGRISWKDVERLVERSYRTVAQKRMLRALDRT
jgi:predicted DNA-binding protein (MmcQ/YjbR family)